LCPFIIITNLDFLKSILHLQYPWNNGTEVKLFLSYDLCPSKGKLAVFLLHRGPKSKEGEREGGGDGRRKEGPKEEGIINSEPYLIL
jgi:hypothetical protein